MLVNQYILSKTIIERIWGTIQKNEYKLNITCKWETIANLTRCAIGILITEENVLSYRIAKLNCVKMRRPDNFSLFSHGCVSTHMHRLRKNKDKNVNDCWIWMVNIQVFIILLLKLFNTLGFFLKDLEQNR